MANNVSKLNKITQHIKTDRERGNLPTVGFLLFKAQNENKDIQKAEYIRHDIKHVVTIQEISK